MGGKFSLGDMPQLSEVETTSKSAVAIDKKVFLTRLDVLALEEQALAELEHDLNKESQENAGLSKSCSPQEITKLH